MMLIAHHFDVAQYQPANIKGASKTSDGLYVSEG